MKLKIVGELAALVVVTAMAMATSSSSASSLVTFIFGDSLTEVGNNNYLQLSLAKANFPHYGIDFDSAIPTGRFTNGRTIGDIICMQTYTTNLISSLTLLHIHIMAKLINGTYVFSAAKLGIPPPPPYLSLSPTDDAILKGVNYASGGAGILNHTGLYFVISLFLS